MYEAEPSCSPKRPQLFAVSIMQHDWLDSVDRTGAWGTGMSSKQGMRFGCLQRKPMILLRASTLEVHIRQHSLTS